MQTHVILLACVKMQPFSRARKLQPVTCPIKYVIHVRRGIISANVTRSKTRQRQAWENMKLMQSASECVGKLPLLETCTIHLPMTCRKSSGFNMFDKKSLFGKWARDRAHKRKGVQPNVQLLCYFFVCTLPFCLNPNIRSTHSCRWEDTYLDSRA